MAQERIVVYTRDWCSYCWRAKRLLKRKGYEFEVVDATNNHELRARLVEKTGQETVPQVFIGDRSVGGYDDIKALDRSGELDRFVFGG